MAADGEKIGSVAAGAAPIDPMATIVDTACEVMNKAGARIDQLIERVNALSEERADLVSLLKRWAALDGGAWHIDHHASNKADLAAETRATIARLGTKGI